jgi:predicted Zn-dependent protease
MQDSNELINSIISEFKNQCDYIWIKQNSSKNTSFYGNEFYMENNGVKSSHSFLIYLKKDKKQILFSSEFLNFNIIRNNIKKIEDLSEIPFLTAPNHKVISNNIQNGFLLSVEKLQEYYNFILKYMQDFIANHKNIDDFTLEGFSINSIEGSSILTTSNGLLKTTENYYNSCSVALIAKNSQVNVERSTLLLNENAIFQDIEKMLKLLFYDVLSRLNAIKLLMQSCPCILNEYYTEYLLSSFLNLLMGSELIDKNTFLENQLDNQVCNENISIEERPKEGYFAYEIDDEGYPLKNKYIVENGILKTYILNFQNAKRLNLLESGNGWNLDESYTNIYVTFKNKHLLENITNGIYITLLLSSNLNNITGEFSSSCAGYKIINGEIKDYFQNATISFNFKEALLNMKGIDIKDIFNEVIFTQDPFFSSLLYIPKVIIA